MEEKSKPNKLIYVGLFFVTLSTLMYEIILTRIFSVTMRYHFAFMVISIAMFGMTVGSILVYFFQSYFEESKVRRHLATYSFLFSIFSVISFFLYNRIPFSSEISLSNFINIMKIYITISIPFIFSGICVSLTLTKFPGQIGRLYAFDLAGAAIGCIMVLQLLKFIDAPNSIILIAFFSCIGTILFAIDGKHRTLLPIAFICLIGFMLASFNAVYNQAPIALLKLKWVKGTIESNSLYEKWNTFSRITVQPNLYTAPFLWGASPIFVSKPITRQLFLNIDADAMTPITYFKGDLKKIEYLKYDVTNIVHFLRKRAKVLVIGSGGGRDILSALLFKQKFIVGLEVNQDILDAVNKKFGDFTGHLNKNPKVKFVNDEARSYIARTKESFDIIQIPLVDSWAATQSGALALTENSLYTVEAFKIFLNHLTKRGVLTISRWYGFDDQAEMYRLTNLACTALKKIGIKNPRENILIVKGSNIGTLLISRDKFSGMDIKNVKDTVKEMQFQLILSPDYSVNSSFESIASGKGLEQFLKSYPFNIKAPTDENPFYFHVFKSKNVFNYILNQRTTLEKNNMAVVVLYMLLVIVFFLTIVCVVIPLVASYKGSIFKDSYPFFVFFTSIGLGYMLIEVSQLQRLIIFLGHPTYSLSVVLFSLLLSSGLGSLFTEKLERRLFIICFLFLLLSIITFGILAPFVFYKFQSTTILFHIIITITMLFPMGFLLGMAFPFGMKLASDRVYSLTPMLWGINGASSILGSILAVVVALNWSISTAFWAGFFCYIIALLALVFVQRKIVI